MKCNFLHNLRIPTKSPGTTFLLTESKTIAKISKAFNPSPIQAKNFEAILYSGRISGYSDDGEYSNCGRK